MLQSDMLLSSCSLVLEYFGGKLCGFAVEQQHYEIPGDEAF